MSSSLPFYIVNAFTTEAFRGNPAAVVFVNETQLEDTSLLQNIAKNFSQPMTAFLHDRSTATSAAFDVRWFTTVSEVELCGHATIASSGLLFSVPGVHAVASKSDVITFKTQEGLLVTARKVDEWAELTFPAAGVTPLPQEKALQMGQIVRKALGKDVRVKFIGNGIGPGFSNRLFVEIEEEDDLAGCVPNPYVFLETGASSNIITSSSKEANVAFVSRMFAPGNGVPEDHVCGSAHCLLTPYWASKLAKPDAELLAKQVSVRGGDIRTIWNEADNTIVLSGQTKVIMKGEVLL